MAYIDPKALAAAGFTAEIKPRAASAVVSIAGLEGSGKTSWALTGPKPLLYQATDFGEDGVIQKAEGQIIRPNRGGYKLDIPHELRAFVERKETEAERRQREGMLAGWMHDNFYRPFHEDFVAGIKAGVRTVVWDNAVDTWEYTRLSVYGREATNRSDLQAEANSKFREMVRLANVHGIVLIMINHLKPKWESYYAPDGAVKWRMAAGEWEMQGFDKAPFLVTLSLWTKFIPPPTGEAVTDGNFELTVKKCRDRAEYVGQTFPALPFPELMGVLIPDVQSWE